MNVKFPHKFSKQEAVQRVKMALVEGRKQLGDKGSIDKEEWVGDTLHFSVSGQGQQIEGTLDVRDHEFEINAKLPLMLRLFEGRIEKMIKEQAGAMLGK